MLLREIANTRMDLNWKHHDNLYLADFELDGIKYGISAERKSIEGVNALEIYFFTYDENGHQDLSMTNLGKNEFKVIGIVQNAVCEKFSNENVIWFSAKTDVGNMEGRKSVYGMIASRIARKKGYFRANGNIGNNMVFVLFKSVHDTDKIHSLLGI